MFGFLSNEEAPSFKRGGDETACGTTQGVLDYHKGMRAVDGFEINADADFVHLWVDEVYDFPGRTSSFGGYDAKGQVDIKCGAYRVRGPLWFSTGEVWQFYTELLRAYHDVAGQAQFCSSEHNLECTLTFTTRGHWILEGTYQKDFMRGTRLQFEIESDQSYLAEPLNQLAQFVAKYGDAKGLHK